MMNNFLNGKHIKTLFLDIGGVLLTNGWGHESRALAVSQFGLDANEMEMRHQLAFETYEMGRMSLDEYLDLVVFYTKRKFTKKDFKEFMFRQSQALEGSINFFKKLKIQHQLKAVAVSNEGRELNEYRITKFGLDTLFDAYISSCYVHLHKPDKEMLRMACDVSHTTPQQTLYVDDRSELVELASAFGCNALHFKGIKSSQKPIETLFIQNK